MELLRSSIAAPNKNILNGSTQLPGQLEDELRLALSHCGVFHLPVIDNVRHFGGILPQQDEIAQTLVDMMEVPV